MCHCLRSRGMDWVDCQSLPKDLLRHRCDSGFPIRTQSDHFSVLLLTNSDFLILHVPECPFSYVPTFLYEPNSWTSPLLTYRPDLPRRVPPAPPKEFFELELTSRHPSVTSRVSSRYGTSRNFLVLSPMTTPVYSSTFGSPLSPPCFTCVTS